MTDMITLGGREIALPELTVDHLLRVATALDGETDGSLVAAINRSLKIISDVTSKPEEELRAMIGNFREINAACNVILGALGLRADPPAGEAAPAVAGS